MEDLPVIPLSYQAFVLAWRSPVASMKPGLANEFWAETIAVQR